MKIAEACEKLTELCHEGKAQEELFILSSEQVPDIDEDGSFGYKLQEAFLPCAIICEKGKVYIILSGNSYLSGTDCVTDTMVGFQGGLTLHPQFICNLVEKAAAGRVISGCLQRSRKLAP